MTCDSAAVSLVESFSLSCSPAASFWMVISCIPISWDNLVHPECDDDAEE